MNHRAVMAMLIGATALTVFPDQPRATAQETLTYFYYQPGTGGTRQPRTGTSPHFVTLAGPTVVGGTLTPGTTIPVQTSFPSTWNTSTTPPSQYALAFVSISGGAEGGITIFPESNGTLPLTVNVILPNTPKPQIIVDVYYFPVGGPCTIPTGCVGGGSGAAIDEWGEIQGTLLNDTFINVNVPADTSLDTSYTTTGNVDGSVVTTNYAVQIDADSTTPTGGNFDRWVSGPGGSIGSPAAELNVGKGVDDYALAFYYSSCPTGYSWTTSATISECTPTPPAPTCLKGYIWNPNTKKCVPISGGCPSTCRFGCYLPRIGPQGQPIWNCKPAPGTCPRAGAINGCSANQYCAVPGPGGTDCNCFKCSPVM
ncbi:MAG: hypothetical protein ACLPXT_12270 [Terracidiphilus sp.]